MRDDPLGRVSADARRRRARRLAGRGGRQAIARARGAMVDDPRDRGDDGGVLRPRLWLIRPDCKNGAAGEDTSDIKFITARSAARPTHYGPDPTIAAACSMQSPRGPALW
ncbi:hypothetical protein SPHINGO8AM_30053 [Sphingomonas sp. 8AM]|nr:hypothetical protein SPHINGO8AM_30053 [Sphingomonas sp. 8AM]